MKQRKIPGWPGYEVSDTGEVYSYPVDGLGQWKSICRELRPGIRHGYRFVKLVDGDNKRNYKIAELVLLTFVGPRPPGMEICHWDGNRANDRLENLRWGTRKENAADTIRQRRERLKGGS